MKTYGVFGLGKSGKATIDYLIKRGDKVFAWDDNEESRRHCEPERSNAGLEPGTPDCRVSLAMTEPSSWDWNKIDELILSPGIPLTHPKPHYIVEAANKHGKKIIGDIELLWLDNQDSTYIGITGTNGKSTTTALIGHILKENNLDVAVGGNLGTPALTLGKHKFYVLEMSSYQLDLIDKTAFDIAVWINISPDHIDRHGDIEGYIKAKKNIFKNPNHTIIIGRDDEYSKRTLEEHKGAIAISKYDKTGSFPRLPGQHNQQNISAAYQVAKAVGIAHKNIIRAIGSFPGLEHRIEQVTEIRGVKYINDSKATNADSASNALAAFDNIYWILGGVSKEGGITSLEQYFPRIKKAYLIGQAADEFAKTLEGKIPYEKCGDLTTAVIKAAKDTTAHPSLDAGSHKETPEQVRGVQPENGVVLLSPACASFDQFKNFEERGAFFKKLVLELRK